LCPGYQDSKSQGVANFAGVPGKKELTSFFLFGCGGSPLQGKGFSFSGEGL